MDNLDTCLEGYFNIFFIKRGVSNLLGKIIDPMTIMIRVVWLMAGCVLIFVRILRISLFFRVFI